MTVDLVGPAPEAAPTRASRRSGWATSTAVYATLFVLCALSAYWAMFSQFAPYDDEGFFDYSLKLFLAGHSLYSSVFTDYGPFYYELFGGLFSILGHGVTTDEGRLVQLAFWLFATFALGISAHRLTGRLALGVTALTTSFLLMVALMNEPMHPEALVCALLSAIIVVSAFGLPRWHRASLFAIGALVAALLLTKINVGGYAVVAVAFAAVVAGRSLGRLTILRWLVTAAFVLVGPAVMFGEIDTGTAQTYALLAVLSTLSLVFVAVPTSGQPGRDDESARWPQWLVGGFATGLVVVIGLIFVLGATPAALFHDVIVVPSHQASLLYLPAELNDNVVWWSLAATAVAWTIGKLGRGGLETSTAEPDLAGGVLRVLAGAAILLSLGDQFPFSIAPDAPFALAMPLAWVAALPSPRIPRGASGDSCAS